KYSIWMTALSCSFIEGYTVQVNVNDYLDIYCPHYNSSQRGVAEQYVLYMVSYRGYRTCDPQLGFKRWECNRPHAPHAPIKFSEKFQRYSAFSLGYEFHVGQEYYYICEYIVCFTSPIHTSKSIVTQYRPQSIRLSIIHPSIQLYFSVMHSVRVSLTLLSVFLRIKSICLRRKHTLSLSIPTRFHILMLLFGTTVIPN
uniref:Ephrin RBD domain-containing protein n=1 Tax=Sinocyclocheilus anshuiensis TaxID=1608454 RepID=A0A671QBY4_9TELE